MERVVMNFHSHINTSYFRFDVLTHKLNNRIYAERIEHSGGKVYVFPPFGVKTISSNARLFDELLSTERYDVVHCHMANAAFIYLKIAEKHNIPIRILHSHQDHYADTWTHAMRNIPLVKYGKRFANVNLACSKAAGQFLFNDAAYTVMNNGIDVDDFAFSSDKRIVARKKLGIRDEEILFGYVGRLVPQKNPVFMLDVFSECLKACDLPMKLVIAGSGELEQQMRRHAVDIGVYHKIIWLGDIDDVAELDRSIDIFLMPSLYEGLGLSLVEAQAAGAECYASDNIPQEAFLTSFVHALPLQRGSGYWASRILAD